MLHHHRCAVLSDIHVVTLSGTPAAVEGTSSSAVPGGGVRLKRLDLHGFKTFASRATLEFAPGITAIVGPNGSGKSNVADAIRWVLGEQSLKLLRGRKSEDVIYAGGPGRALLGMAEVSLTLDNAARALPVDFSEVVISRRAYRSGESEYALNRGRVRLRDVVDVLSRASIGQNGHSVVGQGMVDLALSLRPEERRALFEDAAGARRFRAKKDEAEAKLAQVQANATRAADLIAELEPRVGQLLRQARRAADEARLREQLRLATAAWLAYQRWEIERDQAATEREGARLREAQAKAAQELGRASESAEAARAALATAQATQAALQAAHARQREALEAVRREVAVECERQAAAGRAAAVARAQADRLLQREADAAAAVKPAGEQAAAATAALAAARTRLADAEAVLAARYRAGEAGGRELVQARQAAEEASRALAQATTRHREAERQLAALEKQAVDAADGRRRAAEGARAAAERLETLDRAAGASAERIAALQRTRDEAAGRRDETAVRVQAAETDLAAAERSLETLTARLHALQEVGDAHRGRRSGSPADALPALAGRLRVPPELEAAVAAAAGHALQWRLAVSLDAAEAAAREHAASGGTRLTVAPAVLDAPAAPDNEPSVSTEPASGALATGVPSGRPVPLTRLLEARGSLPGAFRVLIGDTLVARDLDAALAHHRQTPAEVRADVVTLAGERVSRLGAITVGAPPGEAADLRRRRETCETTAALDAAAVRCGPLRETLAAARAERERSAADVRRLDGELHLAQQQASREEGERRSLAQQHARLERDLGWWDDFAGRAAAQRADLQARLTALAAERAAAEGTRAAAAARLAKLAAAAAEEDAERVRLRDGVAAARTAAAVAEHQAAQARQRMAAAAATAAAARSDAEEARRRQADAEQELAARASDVDRAAATLRGCEDEATGADADAAAAGDRVQRLAAEVERLRRRIEAAQAARAQGDRDGALLEARRATLTERLRSLRETAAREIGDLPPASQGVEPADALPARVASLQHRLRGLGPVNQVALQEHAEASERLAFLKTQVADLRAAGQSLEEMKADLEDGVRADFGATFAAAEAYFCAYFTRLFGGGSAHLQLTDPHNLSDTGVEIVAQLPGKRRQELALLSGGERALVAAALLFALLKARPSPFCVMDEVDAALDEANVGRFCDALEELSAQTQFVVITHNRATMERAASLYGVTMRDDGTSRVLSVNLDEASHTGGASEAWTT